MDWTSVFVQDEVGIGRDVQMTLGTRFERNPYTGWEVLPSARLGRSVTPQHFVWTSLSRAVRSPARLDREIVFPPQPPYLIAGGPTFEAEIARTADLGYRGQPSSRFSWSATAFATDYRKLRSAPIDPQGPITIANGLEGQVRGLEAAAQWQVTRPWRLRAGLVLLDKDLRRVAGSNDPVGPSNLGNDPKHQWSLRSSHNLGERVEFDAALHGAGALPQPVVPAYTAVDLRLLWRVRDGVEVSFVARNASDPGHVEYRADPATSEIARSILLAFRWLLP